MTTRTVLRGGSVISADGPVRADVAVDGDEIVHVGHVDRDAADTVVDVSGRLVLPGFIDVHSHADGLLGDPDVALALLRQGVTSVIGGQDGVAYAPGDGAYATEYFAAINGPHPSYRGGGVGAYLSAADGTSALNAGNLIPAGTVRFEVCGRHDGPAGDDERRRRPRLSPRGWPPARWGCRAASTTCPASSRTPPSSLPCANRRARRGCLRHPHARRLRGEHRGAGSRRQRRSRGRRAEGPDPH